MECDITLAILTMMSIQMVMSHSVELYPKSTTAAEVGTDSVNFTCRIQLTEQEVMISHWILWWKDNNRIADNDDVLINSAKYSVHGVSSAATMEYLQILQVNNIKGNDYGEYVCTLVLNRPNMTSTSSDSTILIISNFIFQPVCSISSSESEQQLTLICTSSPGDPPILLHWNDNEGNITAIAQQQQNEPVTLSYTVSVESLSSNLRFTCKATNTESTDTKECFIGNLTSMTMTPTTSTTVSQKLSVPQTVDERAPTISITVSPKLSVSETIDGISTAILTKTTNKAISHSPTLNVTSTSHATKPRATEQNDITTSINVEAETSLLHTYSTSEKLSPSSNNNTVIITIFAILAGVILMTVFIAMLLLLRTHIEKKKNEETHFKMCARENSVHSSSEIEHPEGETDMHINENQDHRLITIEFGDDQLGCAMYKNSIYETNTDDSDPFYAAVGKENVEESQENAATDDPNKTKGIYPLEDNTEYMSIEETALKKATAPPIKAEKPTKFKVKNYPAPNGDMYAQVDRSSISSSDRLSTIMNEEDRVKNYRAPNGDMYTQVDKSSNSKSDRLSTLNNEENKVKNYPAPNGDMYPQVDRSISDRLSTLLINEEQESVRRKKSEGKNDILRDEKKENIGVSKKSSRFIDNDDTYTTISEIAQNGDGEEETDEFTAAENEEDNKHEEDNVSRTSVGSSGSIHYEVDSNALYTRVLKSQKSTTD